MKKMTVLLLSTLMILNLTACGSSKGESSGAAAAPAGESMVSADESTGTDSASESAAMTSATGSEGTAPADQSSEAVTQPEPSATEPENGEGKTLVVYFSATGNTEDVANYIVDATGADVLKLEPVEPYSADDLRWSDENSRVVYEHDNPEARAMELVAATVDDWESYDTVFVGFPIWWGIAAWPIDAFIAANDFTGKTVVPLCTSSSSELGESGELLAEAAGTGNWLTGERFPSSASEEAVREWVESLALEFP